MLPRDPDYENGSAQGEQDHSSTESSPLISYRVAMGAFVVLAVLCFATLHGEARYLALLIVGALALKTWLVKVKSRLDKQ